MPLMIDVYVSHVCACVRVCHCVDFNKQANGRKQNAAYLNFKRPTFPLVVVPSGNARSGKCDSK